MPFAEGTLFLATCVLTQPLVNTFPTIKMATAKDNRIRCFFIADTAFVSKIMAALL